MSMPWARDVPRPRQGQKTKPLQSILNIYTPD